MRISPSTIALPWLCAGLVFTLLAVTTQFGAAQFKDEGSDDRVKKQAATAEPREDSPPQPHPDNSAPGPDTSQPVMLECAAADRFFEDEVWPKVGERTCLKCHQVNGDASESKLLLQATSQNREIINANRLAFLSMATSMEKGRSRLLEKVSGGLDHGGGAVLAADSSGYRILERFVRRSNGTPDPTSDEAGHSDYDAPPFFDGVQMMTPERLLRRVTLSLAGRLPSDTERQADVDRDAIKREPLELIAHIVRNDHPFTVLATALATADYIMVSPYSSRWIRNKGIRVRPEHIHDSLQRLAGIDKHAFSQQFPLAVPDDEKLQGLFG
ncbi:MAG: hypothetical protein O2820_16695 [Planctomycetota bacterium]|nr:hypothetical protein [Planctomycetota bacterium]MDA1250859.1 hypothetical protein [Planctomycetota bacterium]